MNLAFEIKLHIVDTQFAVAAHRMTNYGLSNSRRRYQAVLLAVATRI